MKLYLTVPQQRRPPERAPGASGDDRQAWITGLPERATRDSLTQLGEFLSEIARTERKPMPRLELLDLYRAPLRLLRRQVETQLGPGTPPLSAAHQVLAELLRDCGAEMAYGYKAVVLQLARRGKRRQRDAQRLAMARAMFYLEETIFASALVRQPPAEGSWLEIHTLFQYARQLGTAEDAIRDPVTHSRSATSVSLAYRRALLFGLLDPLRQSLPVMGRLVEFLRRHARLAVLTRSRDVTPGPCQFIIAPLSDSPGYARDAAPGQPPSDDALVLDAAALARSAHDQLQHLVVAARRNVEYNDELRDAHATRLLVHVVATCGLDHGD